MDMYMYVQVCLCVGVICASGYGSVFFPFLYFWVILRCMILVVCSLEPRAECRYTPIEGTAKQVERFLWFSLGIRLIALSGTGPVRIRGPASMVPMCHLLCTDCTPRGGTGTFDIVL